MNKRTIGVLAVCVALLGGCGGGDQAASDGPASLATALPNLESAIASKSRCELAAANGDQVREEHCVRNRPMLQGLPSDAPGLVADDAFTPEVLMDWAETRLPQFFSPAQQPTRVFLGYRYRYYPGTQNFLAESGGNIYVLGPAMTANALIYVGSLASFRCQVMPQSCVAPAAPTMLSIVAQDGGALISVAPPSYSGGSSVLRYNATCTEPNGASTISSASSPIRVTGLKNGTVYACSVTASNAYATGPASGRRGVMPFSVSTPRPSATTTLNPVPTIPAGSTGTFVRLLSEPGEWIGKGATYAYTNANAVIHVEPRLNYLLVQVMGDQSWRGEFKLPSSYDRLQAGEYIATKYPSQDAAAAGMEWWGEQRSCLSVMGSVTIDSAVYEGGGLKSLALRFEQRCNGWAAPLRGEIHWNSADTTVAPGPTQPPADLWRPSPGSVPTAGSYVSLESDVSDYVGGGRYYTYTKRDARLKIELIGSELQVGVTGDEDWTGTFKAMNSLSSVQVGYYGGLLRYPFNNPATGGLSWSGEGRGCNTLIGWFAVDELEQRNGVLSKLKMRFEQNCEGVHRPLRGEIYWTADDASAPPGPINPPPLGLWQPAPGAVPASGNYVYLVSDLGDYVGGGQTYMYTPTSAHLSLVSWAPALRVWSGGESTFWGMNTLSQLQPGYYGELQGHPFHNPSKGGLNWSIGSRGCNSVRGWFAIDEIAITDGVLTRLLLRFAQHCEGGIPALRGQISWTR